MVEITLKLPRMQENYIKYVGDAKAFINQPITIDDKVIGVITKIIGDTDNYIEVEGLLYKSGVDFIKKENIYIPVGITVLNR